MTWEDSKGIYHDMDYAFEIGATPTRRGRPVAFIEVAWRRYTKHSRNKAGEIQSALVPLRDTYPTVRFVGAVIAGHFTPGGIEQLERSGIHVIHLPWESIRDALSQEEVRIDYAEDAGEQEKARLNQGLDRIVGKRADALAARLWAAIEGQFADFEREIEEAIGAHPVRVRISTLYGEHRDFASIEEAVQGLLAEAQPDRTGLEPFG